MDNYTTIVDSNFALNQFENNYTMFQQYPVHTGHEEVLLSPVHLNLRERHIKEMPIKYLNTVLKMKNLDKNQIKMIKQYRRKMKIRDYAEINKIRTVLSDRRIQDQLKHLTEIKDSLQTTKQTLIEEINQYKQLMTL